MGKEQKVFKSFKDAFGIKDNNQESVFLKDGKPLDLENYSDKPNKEKTTNDSKQEG